MADGSFHDLLGVSSTPEQSVRSRPLSVRDRFADLLMGLDMPPKEAYAVLDKIGDSPFGALVEGFGAISPSGISETGAKIREQHEEPSIFDTPTEKATKFGENRLKDLVFGVGLAAGGSGAGGGGKVIFNKFMERLRKKTLTDKQLYEGAVETQKIDKIVKPAKAKLEDEYQKSLGLYEKIDAAKTIEELDAVMLAAGRTKEELEFLSRNSPKMGIKEKISRWIEGKLPAPTQFDAPFKKSVGKKVDMIDEVMKEEGFVKKGTEETGIKYVDKAKGNSKELFDKAYQKQAVDKIRGKSEKDAESILASLYPLKSETGKGAPLLHNLDDLIILKKRSEAKKTIQKELFEAGKTDSLGFPKATKKPLLLTKEMENQATFILNYQDAKLHVRPWKEEGLMSLYDNHNKRVSPYFEKSEDMYKWFSENYGKPK